MAPQAKPKAVSKANDGYTNNRETYDNIYLDLSKEAGKLRFADSGIGWKPLAGGDTWTLDRDQILQGLWSRAARGYELKINTRTGEIAQLDGFQADVSKTAGRCVGGCKG
jgi:structure-specific recognition protein 1